MDLSVYSLGLLILDLIFALWVTGHVLLTKSDPRAALGWIALAFLAPLIGSLLYFVLGINRVNTRARRLASKSPFASGQPAVQEGAVAEHIAAMTAVPYSNALTQVAYSVTGIPLLCGNRVDCLHNGEEAYPPMLQAIEQAERQLFMTTYIFETTGSGEQFIDALERTVQRGVDVRVIIDGVGELTNIPRASTVLMRRGVRVGRFIPPSLIPPSLSINLRNHRKILIADDQVAFTGGMNITSKHLADDTDNPNRMTDLHFRLRGPIVHQLKQSFLEDWGFVTDEREAVESLACGLYGESYCRVIPDGPNEYLDQLTKVLAGVICCAERRIGIISPYFLPPRELTAVMQAAALRGVEVQVILPAVSDNAIVQWATRHILSFLMTDGIEFYWQPAPFSHSKLLLIDDSYSLIGSANMDPRSLRLNFELGVEVFDHEISYELWDHFETLRRKSHQITPDQLKQRSLPHKLRDSLAWVCSPYL